MGSSLVAQWVKNLALSLHQMGLLLWHGFNPWPRNFHSKLAPQKWLELLQWQCQILLFLLHFCPPGGLCSSQARNQIQATVSAYATSYGNTWSFNPLCQAKDRTCTLGLQRWCRSLHTTAGTPMPASSSSFFFFLGPYLLHMEVPRLGVESEL